MLRLSRTPWITAMDRDNMLSKEQALGNLDDFFGHVDLNEDGFIGMGKAETAQKLLAQRQGN